MGNSISAYLASYSHIHPNVAPINRQATKG